MIVHFAALLFLQQVANTSPIAGDTVGYWQQRIAYTIVARLDEPAPDTRLRARAELLYVNNSPDVIREMYFHQYLNAFRPGSRWSDVDEREGRVRFQHLQEPDYGYERFTATPTFDGVAVSPAYPGAPDSTVVRFTLPRPLNPHDSIRVAFAWDARPSTVPRRQGRRGRSWDFAQWYPKVAVYDRGGWEPNALVPAGELYGEFGTYDVTMVVANDQIIGATGVPVSGDPGWERAKVWGELRLASTGYEDLPPAPPAEVPAGFRAVRFVARDVHQFAWTASPDYRYEGGTVVRTVAPQHFKTWDTVSIHVLYKPGDDTTWGGGRAVNRTIFALKWLESIWGPYAYPQMSNVHRIDGGGTEFPMMVMDGSADRGLILHEAGHIFTYGILANNEWRSGWMDEGLTSYQTAWALGQTRQEQVQSGLVPPPPRLPEGYRMNALAIPISETADLEQVNLDLLDRAQPIGTNSADFREFGIYNAMIYDRAQVMYGQLRDVVGDDAFRAFFHDYYTRWALKHVDVRAMQASAERASGIGLGWFFDQWVYQTGLTDYALRNVTTTHRADGRWVTRAEIARRGEYHHPMSVGARTSAGWTIARGEALTDDQTVEIVTAEQPSAVQLDPYHYTFDWDRRNDVIAPALLGVRRPRGVLDWPFLDQADRDHSVVALSPRLWYSEPNGVMVGVRARSSYLTTVDRYDFGAGFASRTARALAPGGEGGSVASRLEVWARTENPYLPFASRPLMGQRAALAFLDGIIKADWSKTWDESEFLFAPGPMVLASVYASGAYPTDHATLPEQWQFVKTTEAGGSLSVRTPPDAERTHWSFGATGGVGLAGGSVPAKFTKVYERMEASAVRVQEFEQTRGILVLRGFAGITSPDAPLQRQIFASTQDPYTTFQNDYFRPRGAVLKQAGINFIPLGGGALRGYDITLAFRQVVAGNAEVGQRVAAIGDRGSLRLWVSAFGDAAFASPGSGALFSDAGAGASLRGRFYDRDVRLRVDLPVFVNQNGFAGGRGLGGSGSIAARWVFSLNDLW